MGFFCLNSQVLCTCRQVCTSKGAIDYSSGGLKETILKKILKCTRGTRAPSWVNYSGSFYFKFQPQAMVLMRIIFNLDLR